MTFKDMLRPLREGKKVRLPICGGYWQKVSALIDIDKIVCWTIVDVHEDGSIKPISDKKFNNLK